MMRDIREGVADGFSTLSKLEHGVWLVRLVKRKGHRIDHFVALEAGNGIILDSEEDFPLLLTATSLRM